MSPRDRELVNNIIAQLRSDVVKERQSGLAALQEFFQRDSAVEKFPHGGGSNITPGNRWLMLFKAVFTAVLNEIDTCKKKGVLTLAMLTSGPGAINLQRLADTASKLRWLVDRTVKHLSSKVVGPLVEHLLQAMLHRGELVPAVALPYMKALNCICSYAPHLEHLHPSHWANITGLAFNVILEDPLRTRLEDIVAVRSDVKTGSPAYNTSQEDEVQSTADDVEYEESSSSTLNPSRKRRRPSIEPLRGGSQAPRTSSALLVASRSQPVTLEQIECMSILTALLHSTSAPLLSWSRLSEPSPSPDFGSAVLNRLERFIQRYPLDTSLHHDYLLSLSSVLSHIALNRCELVSTFAQEAWHGLVGMWSTRNQRMKEELVAIMKLLLPFYTRGESEAGPSGRWYEDGVLRLWNLLDSEVENRRGFSGLPLDSLRLEISRKTQPSEDRMPFVAETFRYGWHFGTNEVLTWVILELQADCTAKLYTISEATPMTSARSRVSEGKRVKVDDPVTSLLNSIKSHMAPISRIYRMQILLFFIDRHWSLLHDGLQQDVISTLMQFLSFDDASVQSWAFVALAATVHAKAGTTEDVYKHGESENSIWDSIWMHSMRRSHAAIVCRAACHTASVLLQHAKRLLTWSRILSEIETFGAELDVQGPAFPYDSVCTFLDLCLQIASQDVRLYKMQLEEKVLTWLIGAWRPEKGRRLKMPLHLPSDVLSLMTSICVLSKKSDVVFRALLPDCHLSDTMLWDVRTGVIRDFILHARLPSFESQKPGDNSETATHAENIMTTSEQREESFVEALGMHDLDHPRSRERRLSSFLLNTIEEMSAAWDGKHTVSGYTTAEKVRMCLDLSAIALCFEHTLVLNGTRSNRRTIQAACKLIGNLAPFLEDRRWTPEERFLVLDGIMPLVAAVDIKHDHFERWGTLLPPETSSGIRRSLMLSLRLPRVSPQGSTLFARGHRLRQLIFQSADVQDAFEPVLNAVRHVLRLAAALPAESGEQPADVVDPDFADHFTPARTPQEAVTGPAASHQRGSTNLAIEARAISSCMTILAVVPLLQSGGNRATRDRELADLLLECDDEQFLLIAPSFLENIRQRVFNLNVCTLQTLLTRCCDELRRQHAYSRSERFQLLVIHLLHVSQDVWLRGSPTTDMPKNLVQELFYWLAKDVKNGRTQSWLVRDYLTRFLVEYLQQDPTQEVLVNSDDGNLEIGASPDWYPIALLPTMSSDSDVRVRFRAAVANAQTFPLCQSNGRDPRQLYESVKSNLSIQLDEYEHIMTRLLCLGNIMVVSSGVRRGPYWHLLEPCLHTRRYALHIETILKAVGERLGLSKFSELFEAYASQIAFSFRQSGLDFRTIPPHIFGYSDRRECAIAAFRAFTPTNLLGGGDAQAQEHGFRLFVAHCATTGKTPEEGLLECFPDIIGLQILIYTHDGHLLTDTSLAGLATSFNVTTKSVLSEVDFTQRLVDHADAITVAILRTLLDQDCTPDGSIRIALRQFAYTDATPSVFGDIVSYRLADVGDNQPNLPSYGVDIILQALIWFGSRLPEATTAGITYHVLHQLFAAIDRSVIVGEQIRLLNALCIWIAFHEDHFQDGALLRNLIHGASILLGQSDLARAAQSLLEWSLGRYVSLQHKDERLTDTLIRIARVAYDYAHNTVDQSVAGTGKDLMQWIEAKALQLHRHRSIRPQVVKALAAWPQELPADLAALCINVKPSDISEILADHRIAASKFRLVRRLRDLSTDESLLDRFTKGDFWRLRECIPQASNLLDDDIDAFAALLLASHGITDGFGDNQPLSEHVLARHRTAEHSNEGQHSSGVARYAIVSSLLAMLDGTSTLEVYTAYCTLRSLLSVFHIDDSVGHAWLSDHRGELHFLQLHSKPFKRGVEHDLSENLNDHRVARLGADFNGWSTFLGSNLCQALSTVDPFYVPVSTLLLGNCGLSDKLLPIIVHTVLLKECAEDAWPGQNGSYRDLLSHHFTSLITSDDTSVSCLRAVINIILHLRHFRPPGSKDALGHDKWLHVNFVELSKCAIKTGAYTTALLCLELAAEYTPDAASDTSVTENILYTIYSHVDEPDGFYGIQTQDVQRFLLRRLHHEQQWDKAFRFHGAALEAGSARADHAAGVVQALQSFGFSSLAVTASTSFPGQLGGTTYSLGWRTAMWDLPGRGLPDKSEQSLYQSLRAVHRERNHSVIDSVLKNALVEELCRLRTLGQENFTEIHDAIRNIMCLQQIKHWRSRDVRQAIEAKQLDKADWDSFAGVDSGFRFNDMEAIMATRVSLVQSARLKEQREQIGNLSSPFCKHLMYSEARCMLRLSEAARSANQPQIALNCTTRAIELLPEADEEGISEYANVLWLMKEPKIAVQLLDDLLITAEGNPSQHGSSYFMTRAQRLAQVGSWSAEASLCKAADISSRYFQPAVAYLEQLSLEVPRPNRIVHASIYHQYALFAERQYHSIVTSPDALRWKVYVDRKTEEIKQREEQLAKVHRGTDDYAHLSREQSRAKKLLRQDKALSSDHIRARDSFLKLAVDMHARSLETSDDFDDDSSIRICSLWLANFDYVETNVVFDAALRRIPSHKFVFLSHQLSARLSKPQSSSPSGSQQILQALLRRVCREHPFHSLYQVFCLIGDRQAPAAVAPNRRQSGRHISPSTQAERSAAAADLFNILRDDGTSGDRLRLIERVCIASLKWAKQQIRKGEFKIDLRSKGPFKIPDTLDIVQLRNIRVPVITAQTSVDPTIKYDNCIWINRYESTFRTAGGVSLPKISICIGSDGKKYKQLFKGEGEDDLRQDAVMEQVFDRVNVLLQQDRETARRNLRVRGYKVLPLAEQAGVLEFVDNTIPVSGWLPSAHLRYRPNDWDTKRAQGKLSDTHKTSNNETSAMLEAFMEVREHFKPVMRHFFSEKHKNPLSWYSMRLDYGRSVATTSIVGHILGLGDRHTSNILIDNITGEVVHIDLGVAFDQGKLLPVPERVPFRLTADMVDGLGMSGTQGVFQRCAEETLRVLRERSEVIMTVLEVFRHDPLHSWTVSEVKVKRVQGSSNETALTGEAFRYAIGIDMTSGSADEAADRALQSVSRKLDTTLSVEYTVNELIAEATDTTNLATMYPGWGPQY